VGNKLKFLLSQVGAGQFIAEIVIYKRKEGGLKVKGE